MSQTLTDLQSIDIAIKAFIAGRIAFGKNAGQKVTRLGSGFGYAEEILITPTKPDP